MLRIGSICYHNDLLIEQGIWTAGLKSNSPKITFVKFIADETINLLARP